MKDINNFIKPGKANMIIDGQFGSTGKGLIASYIAENNHIDIACGRLSPNAGHTFYVNKNKYITKLIPVAGILQSRSTIYLGHGCVINPYILSEEIKKFDIDEDRIVIHPRTAVITDIELYMEQTENSIVSIASTQSGSGAARATKILRKNHLAQENPYLKRFCKPFTLDKYLDMKLNVLIETGQGFDLGINTGFKYPYVTSIDVTPSAILADFSLHPRYMGNCMMSLRSFPIRVGNLIVNGEELGYSGDVYDDCIELDWTDINKSAEITTVTNRPRRIFTFSKKQYVRAIRYIQPTHIFLNFINYLREEDLNILKGLRKPDYVGYGPYTENVVPYDTYIFRNYIDRKVI